MTFLDDILMMWTGETVELQQFLDHLNGMMHTINFTIEQNKNSNTFLYLEVYKGKRFQEHGILDIKPFKKTTNPQNFLHFESCHPKTTFSTIVKGELLRALHSSSDTEAYTNTIKNLFTRFQQRGYPKDLLMEISSSIHYGDRAQYHQPRPKKKLEENTTVFSVRYHPSLASNVLRDSVLDLDRPFLPMLTRPRPFSMQDILGRAKTKFHISRRQATGQPLINHPNAAAALPPPPQDQAQDQDQ